MGAPRVESLAFGVEPGHLPYRLRQARYHALAEDVARFVAASETDTVRLLDVGVGRGVTRLYLEVHPESARIQWHAVDRFPRGEARVHRHADWTLHHRDLEQGLGPLADGSFDVVVCEQLLEHLHDYERTLADLERALRPGGLLVLGVPIFPPGLDVVRRHLVPPYDRCMERLFGVLRLRTHVQAFTLRSFLRRVEALCPGLERETARGTRLVSGGPLRPLENYRWWWRLNRRLGRALPAVCPEVQAIYRRR